MGQLLEHRCKLARLLARIHHRPIHLAERLRELVQGVCQRVALCNLGAHLQHHRFDRGLAALISDRLQALIQWQCRGHQSGQLPRQQRQIASAQTPGKPS